MDFLIFYIISTIIVLLIKAIIIKSVSNQLKRELPDFKEKQKKITISEKIANNLMLLLPLINIGIIIILIFSQDDVKNDVRIDVYGKEKKEETNERYYH